MMYLDAGWKRILLRLGRDDRGSMVVYVMLTMVVMLSLLGVIVDGGWQTQRKVQAQGGSDAAAMTALEYQTINPSNTDETNPTNAAAKLLLANWGLTSTVTSRLSTGVYQVVGPNQSKAPFTMTLSYYAAGTSSPFDTPTDTANSAITVTAHIWSNWPRLFLNLGVGNPSVETQGIAALKSSTSQWVVVAMQSSGQDLLAVGSGAIHVTGGSVLVNSTSSNASCLQGSANLTASSIGVAGGWSSSGCLQLYTPTPVAVSTITDPFASIVMPTSAATAIDINSSSNIATATVTPGVYQSLSLHNSQQLLLQGPGTFIFTGPVSLIGNSRLSTAGGATLFFTCQTSSGAVKATPCATPQSTGGLNVSNGTTIQIAAPTSGQYKGMAIMYDRNITAPLAIVGGGSDTLTGSIYALASQFQVTNGGIGTAIDSRIVVASFSLAGSGLINVTFHQSNNANLQTKPGLTTQ